MERKIGEIFEYNGEWYQCVKSASCYGCAFLNSNCIGLICSVDDRTDNCSAIFKKLEKVGEPYNKLGIVVQKYKVDIPIEMPDEPNMYFRLIDNTVEIEIKQNKENMEEKKVKLDRLVTDYTSNKITYNEFEKAVKELYADKEESKPSLKSFSLESAKSGNPVYTRDGRNARIICFDRISGDGYKIVACVTSFDGDFEEVLFYDIDGYVVDSQNPKDEDLMMLSEKKEGWVNVYHDNEGNIYTDEYVFNTEKDAIVFHPHNENRKATVKIEWYE